MKLLLMSLLVAGVQQWAGGATAPGCDDHAKGKKVVIVTGVEDHAHGHAHAHGDGDGGRFLGQQDHRRDRPGDVIGGNEDPAAGV